MSPVKKKNLCTTHQVYSCKVTRFIILRNLLGIVIHLAVPLLDRVHTLTIIELLYMQFKFTSCGLCSLVVHRKIAMLHDIFSLLY